MCLYFVLNVQCIVCLMCIECAMLNLSNVYGPRQDPHGEAGVVSIFANKYLNNKEPIIYGDGEQTRDYIYVKDVVSALTKASKIDQNHFLNIGTGVETSVNDLANSMKIQFNSDINPVYKPARKGELNRSVLNNAKAKNNRQKMLQQYFSPYFKIICFFIILPH